MPACTEPSRYPAAEVQYPQAQKADVVDDYHGVKVADPYRWLENSDTPETRQWIDAENKVTFAYLEQIPAREKIRERLTKLWDYEKYGIPFQQGGRYFFSKNDGLQNQSVIYTMRTLQDEPKILIDPNKLSADGTIALTSYAISEDGKYMAYGLATAGSDWQEWRVRDIDTGNDLDDHIKWVKFSGGSWTHDGKGFFYSRYDTPAPGEELAATNYFHKLYYHQLGSPQSADQLVYERPDQKEWGFGGGVTEDGAFLIIHVWKGTERKNGIFYKELTSPGAEVVELLKDFDAEYDFIGNDGRTFWFRTDLAAPRARVIAINIDNPARENWKEIIPESADTLRGVSVVNDTFIGSYLKDAHTQVRTFELNGKPARMVKLPGIGSASGFDGKRSYKETFYAYSSFTAPTTIYRYDMVTGQSAVFKKPEVGINPDDFVTKQVFYQGKDGTRIPMFITHKKDLKLTGNNPTFLYGYGGFNIAVTPSFSVSNVVWMEMGGVYAVANIRGGGEYGKEWHEAGMKLTKQNCFDDFIAAGEWLIKNRYTSSGKLAIGGGSNGGLLVGACITQRPDLFAAALPAVGVMDMLRFNKFTIGWAWTSDYGSPENKEEFDALYKYSPLHNLKRGTKYPSVMITTADHDDRVVPAHSFKFAAALQEAHAGDNPVLIRIETKAGHGAGKPTTKQIEEAADKWAFLVRELNMPGPES
jgi:prolyl oligopeptidase